MLEAWVQLALVDHKDAVFLVWGGKCLLERLLGVALIILLGQEPLLLAETQGLWDPTKIPSGH